MKFLVIGHLCLDVIHPVDGPEMHGYGGIFYSVATLAALLNGSHTVVPVFGVNNNDYTQLQDLLAQFENVETAGIFPFDEPTNSVHLFYKDAATRIECSKDIARPIPFERIQRFLNVDGVLVNMISGSDLTVDTLDNIRMAIRGKDIPIHFDYHSLTLGINEHHERFRRPVEDWRRWAFMTDTVQLNEEEIIGLPIEKLTERQIAGHMLTLGGKGVLVTKGEGGVTLYTNDHKRIMQQDIAGVPVERPRDATGCGDVFGAAFLMHYTKTRDLLTSAQIANTVAAAKARMIGSDHMHLLKQSLVPA